MGKVKNDINFTLTNSCKITIVYLLTLNLLLSLPAFSEDKSCMEKVNLQPTTEKETESLTTCILAEIVKMGYPLCDENCLKRLTQEEREQHFDLRARQMKYLMEKELERRVVEQIKR